MPIRTENVSTSQASEEVLASGRNVLPDNSIPLNSRGRRVLPIRMKVSFVITFVAASLTLFTSANFFDEVLPSMVNPGACLDQLDAPWDSGYVFDSIFSANSGSANRSDIIDQQSPDAHSDHVGPSLRAYGSDQDMCVYSSQQVRLLLL